MNIQVNFSEAKLASNEKRWSSHFWHGHGKQIINNLNHYFWWLWKTNGTERAEYSLQWIFFGIWLWWYLRVIYWITINIHINGRRLDYNQRINKHSDRILNVLFFINNKYGIISTVKILSVDRFMQICSPFVASWKPRQ